ncbi:MAG TPA: hypothetical protein VIL36_19980 [Acidimicrobiales bacterium]
MLLRDPGEADDSPSAPTTLEEENLQLRDALIGKEAMLATALGRVRELEVAMLRFQHLEQRLDAILRSRSWRLIWAAGTPVRLLRGGGGLR